MDVSSLSALLLLADGRYPAGGHAHSGGLEVACATGRVHDVDSLAAFLRGRLATAGLVAAAFAAAAREAVAREAVAREAVAGEATAREAAGVPARLAELDAELDARTASPALRVASRRQGRALARAGRATWPSPVFGALPADPHQPVALGTVAAAAGLAASDAALVAAYGVLTGPAASAVRLLALDPYPVQALLARLAGACDETAARGAAYAHRPLAGLPAATAPLADIGAELHATWEVRLFAS
ncbi:MAG: urease accessory protein [Micromonosporaceae bacterium]